MSTYTLVLRALRGDVKKKCGNVGIIEKRNVKCRGETRRMESKRQIVREKNDNFPLRYQKKLCGVLKSTWCLFTFYKKRFMRAEMHCMYLKINKFCTRFSSNQILCYVFYNNSSTSNCIWTYTNMQDASRDTETEVTGNSEVTSSWPSYWLSFSKSSFNENQIEAQVWLGLKT